MTGDTTDGTGVCISFCVRQLVTTFASTSTPTSKIHVVLVHVSILPGISNELISHPYELKERFINWCFSCSLNTLFYYFTSLLIVFWTEGAQSTQIHDMRSFHPVSAPQRAGVKPQLPEFVQT